MIFSYRCFYFIFFEVYFPRPFTSSSQTLGERVFRNQWRNYHSEERHGNVSDRASSTVAVTSVSLTLIA